MDTTVAVSWNAVLLGCKECHNRSDGPGKVKPKELVDALKRSVRDEHPRPRVLPVSCLGLCPKRATAVARIGGQIGDVRIAAVKSPADAAKSMSR